MKDKVSSLSKKGLAISITEEMLLYGIQEYMKDKDITIYNINVEDNAINIYGSIKKIGLPIKFSLTLAQEDFNEKEIFLRVTTMKPLNNKWLNNMVFNNRSQYLSYSDNIIQLDINVLEKMKKIRLGRITNFKILQGKVVVNLSN